MQEGEEQERKKENLDKKKKNEKRKRTVSFTKENDRCASFGPSIYVRINFFIIKKLT